VQGQEQYVTERVTPQKTSIHSSVLALVGGLLVPGLVVGWVVVVAGWGRWEPCGGLGPACWGLCLALLGLERGGLGRAGVW